MAWFKSSPKRLPQASSKATNLRLTQYYRASPQLPAQTRQPRPWRQGLGKALNWLVILAIAAGAAYNLLLKPSPNLLVSSQTYRPLATYRQAVVAELKKPKNRTKLTIDQAAIQKALQAKMPEIAFVNVSSPLLGQTPTLKLAIAAPALLVASGSSIYLVDEQGIAVARASELPKLANLPRLDDQSGFTASVGQAILNSSAVTFINGLIAQAKRANVPIASLTLPALAQEIDLRTTDRPYYVKFYLNGDTLAQIGQFLAARHSFDASGNQPSGYLDVRVAGKVYYQ